MNDERVSEQKPMWPWLVGGIVGALVVSQLVSFFKSHEPSRVADPPIEPAAPRHPPPRDLADAVYLRFIQDEVARSSKERLQRAVDATARKHSLSPDVVRHALERFAAGVEVNASRSAHEAAMAAVIRGRPSPLPSSSSPVDPLGVRLHQLTALIAARDWRAAESGLLELRGRTDRSTDTEAFARVRAAEFLLRYEQGDLNEAFAIARDVRALRERILPPDSPGIARALENVAVCLARFGRHEEAVPLFRRALGIYEKAYGPDDVDVADTASVLTASLAEVHRLAEAEAHARRAIAIFAAAGENQALRLALTFDRLGEAYLVAGRNAEAEAALRQAVEIYDRNKPGARPKDHSDAVHRLGLSIARQDRRREALPYLVRSTEIAANWYADDDPLYAVLFHNLAVWADGAGDDPLTVRGYERALQILARVQRRTRQEPSQMRQTRDFYAAYLQRTGLSQAEIQRRIVEAIR